MKRRSSNARKAAAHFAKDGKVSKVQGKHLVRVKPERSSDDCPPIGDPVLAAIPEAPVVEMPSDEVRADLSAAFGDSKQPPIYIVWTVGSYANGVRLLDIRAVCGSLGKAKLYSKMLRQWKEVHREMWDRVIIEPRVANHLYGEKLREFMVNTGAM